MGTNRLIGASASSITKQIAISGACWDAANSAHAPSRAYMPIEFVWNICIHRMPSNAPPEAPSAIPGCNTPPEAPERIVNSVTIAFARNETNKIGSTAKSTSDEKLNCAVARPLPITCGTQIATTPVSKPASGSIHKIPTPDGLAFSAHCEPRRNSAPAAPRIMPATSANAM